MSLRGQTKAFAASGASQRMLVVTSGATNLALSAPVVEGIMSTEEAGAQDSLTIRGITYHVTHLPSRWGTAPTPGVPQTQVILCGNRGLHRAYWVDQVLGLTEVPSDQIRELPSHFACEELTWFKGFFLFRDAIAVWVNPDWLVSPEQEDDQPYVDTARFVVEGPSPSGEAVEVEVIDAESAE